MLRWSRGIAVSTNPRSFLTPEEYLEIERKAEFRSEYYRGEMFAMSGATGKHNIIAVNLVTEMHNQLRRGPCQVYTHDLRVRTGAAEMFTYPDVLVACRERKFLDAREDTLLNPVVIIEILSESTEAYDRGKKFDHYRTFESLKEYILICQDRVQVECFRRQADGQWLLTVANRLEDAISLDSVHCTLNLADVYEGVGLSEATA
jgi:Uma2 family endonuclease